jgi:hypothetical protein
VRGALVVSGLFAAGLVFYFVGAYVWHLADSRRRAEITQSFYALHCRDSISPHVEFRPRAETLALADTAELKTDGAFDLEYYDAAAPENRQLLAIVKVKPYGNTKMIAHCEVYCEPVSRENGQPWYPGRDSIWRKGYYLARPRDSLWQRESVVFLPRLKTALHSQITNNFP